MQSDQEEHHDMGKNDLWTDWVVKHPEKYNRITTGLTEIHMPWIPDPSMVQRSYSQI